MKYNWAFIIISCILFISCGNYLYTPQNYSVKSFLEKHPEIAESHQTIKSHDSLIVKADYKIGHEFILENYVFYHVSIDEKTSNSPAYRQPVSSEETNIQNYFINAMNNLDVTIVKANIMRNKTHRNFSYNHTMVPEFIDKNLLFQIADIKDERIFIVPYISVKKRTYNLDTHGGFEFHNCTHISLFLLNRNDILYSKSSYMCTISYDIESNFVEETELTQAEWDLLVYELMREYLERLE